MLVLLLCVSEQRDPTPEREVKVEIPEELKKWLADDWDLVTRQKQVYTQFMLCSLVIQCNSLTAIQFLNNYFS